MRHLLLLILLASPFAFGQQAAQPTPSTKTAKIEEIFRLTKTDEMQKQMMSQMGVMMKQQLPSEMTSEQKTGVVDSSLTLMNFMSKKLSWDAMKPDYIHLYDETYTEDEISGILLFYQSAPGQAMLAKSQTLMANTMTLMQKRMAEIKPEIEEIIRKSAH